MNKKTETLEKVKCLLKDVDIPLQGASLVLGLSGGSDSVALLLILKDLSAEYGWTLTAVHVDHGIRPAESRRRDLEFCRDLCKRLGISFCSFSEEIPALSQKEHLSLEEAGRIRRYERFEEVRRERNADLIVTAHHLDDQEETILLHLLRGCGLKGLCGMEPYDPERKLLRPLLEIRKKELEDYLELSGQDHVTDETNFEEDAVRNRIRHQVLPTLREAVPEYSGGNLAGNAHRFREMELDYTERARSWVEGHLIRQEEGELVLSLWRKDEEPPALPLRIYIVRECIRRVSGSFDNVGEVHLSAIRALMEGGTGKKQLWPGGGVAIRSYDTMIFRWTAKDGPEKGKDKDKENEIVKEKDSSGPSKELIGVRLREADPKEKEDFWADPASFSQNTCFQYIDYDKMIGSLWIRTRRPGDVFATGRDGGRKKLQDVLVDLKVPAEEREKLLLVGTGEHEVIWIPGLRLSPFYFVRPETERIGRLEIFDSGKEQHGRY